MEIKIDLDMNKIDYNTINKLIVEKVAALNINEVYDVENRIENKLNNLIKEEVDYSYNNYIDKYWKHETSEGKKLIETMCKTEIENRVKIILDDIFSNEYNEETMRNMLLKSIPDVFTYALFGMIESGLYSKEYNYRENIHRIVKENIESTFGPRY